MYLNTVAVGSANMIANFTGNYFAKRFKAKRTYIYCWGASLSIFVLVFLT